MNPRETTKTSAPVLLTGFEPFGGESVNASEEIVRCLKGRRISGRTVVGGVLPCVFGAAIVELERLLAEAEADVVVCLGQAAGRTAITPERIAINVEDARIPDNAGCRPLNQPVVPDGPMGYLTTLPIRAMVETLTGRGIPARVSGSAGTFVCNQVFYGLMHRLATRPATSAPSRGFGTGPLGGFIHVPRLEGQAPGQPGLPLSLLTEGIDLAIEVAVQRAAR